MPCCHAFVRELKAPIFDFVEHTAPSTSEGGPQGESVVRGSNNNTRHLDIEKTLSPRPRLLYIGAKLFVMAWSVSILYMCITQWKYPYFGMAYLTYWGFTVTTAYTIMSFLSAVYLAMRPPANPGVLEGGVGLLVKTTWVSVAILSAL